MAADHQLEAEDAVAPTRTTRNPTASVASPSSSRLDRTLRVLALLQESDQVLRDANAEHWKPFAWHLTKARQSSQRMAASASAEAFGASNVRQDLTARLRLVEIPEASAEEPDLVVDDDSDERGTAAAPSDSAAARTSERAGARFALVDVVERAAAASSTTRSEESARPEPAVDYGEAASAQPTSTGNGLRQRRGTKQLPPSPSAHWTVEHGSEVTSPPSAAAATVPDPIDLFGGGLVPRELRAAQDDARRALEAYVRAANLRRQIQSLLPLQPSNDK